MSTSPRKLLIFLLCGAFGVLYLLLPESPDNLTVEPVNIVQERGSGPSIIRTQIDEVKIREDMKRVMKGMDESFEKADEQNTPEVREMVSRASKNQLPKKYGPLFAKWNISPELSKRTLDMIYERDERLREASYKRDKEGRSGIPEYKLTEATERQSTRLQLELLLGKDRAAELAWTEVEQEYEALARLTGKSVNELKEQRRNGQVTNPRSPTLPPLINVD